MKKDNASLTLSADGKLRIKVPTMEDEEYIPDYVIRILAIGVMLKTNNKNLNRLIDKQIKEFQTIIDKDNTYPDFGFT